jgi:hypothetical protein
MWDAKQGLGVHAKNTIQIVLQIYTFDLIKCLFFRSFKRKSHLWALYLRECRNSRVWTFPNHPS